MKRIGNLYERIISVENLRLADEKARKGKLNSYGVRIHDKHREENILALHETLKNGTFKNSEYSTFTIYEPKERGIFNVHYRTSDIQTSVLSGQNTSSCNNERIGADMGKPVYG